MTSGRPSPTVAVVGGGLAGLATAVALREHGCRVELFEERRHLGGRAGSLWDPQAGQWIDYGQHVGLGCCTNLADFCRRIGMAECFGRERTLHFLAPDGRRYRFAPSRWLPAPLHLLPSLMGLRYLDFRERLGIVRAAGRLCAVRGCPEEEPTIGSWLRQHGQSERAIGQFWSVVLLSALSETVEHISLSAGRKVLVDGLLGSRRAGELLVPRGPLGQTLHRAAAQWLDDHQAVVHLGTSVRQIEGEGRRATAVALSDGSRRPFDHVVLAVPWRRVRALLGPPLRAAMPMLDDLDRIQPGAITAVHLWFDRPLTDLPHAVLIGRQSACEETGTGSAESQENAADLPPDKVPVPVSSQALSQWVFSGGSSGLGQAASQAGHYYQAVISASHRLLGAVGSEERSAGRRREQWVNEVRRDFQAAWPEARGARLLHWRVVTQPAAVFSVEPGVDRLRPPQSTAIENLVLAGDWTATGWPATMEGAVRSGHLAAEAVLRQTGTPHRVLVPDLPRGPLVRLLLSQQAQAQQPRVEVRG